MEDKKFGAKKLISREVQLKDLNDVFSDMRKNKIIGKLKTKPLKLLWRDQVNY